MSVSNGRSLTTGVRGRKSSWILILYLLFREIKQKWLNKAGCEYCSIVTHSRSTNEKFFPTNKSTNRILVSYRPVLPCDFLHYFWLYFRARYYDPDQSEINTLFRSHYPGRFPLIADLYEQYAKSRFAARYHGRARHQGPERKILIQPSPRAGTFLTMQRRGHFIYRTRLERWCTFHLLGCKIHQRLHEIQQSYHGVCTERCPVH